MVTASVVLLSCAWGITSSTAGMSQDSSRTLPPIPIADQLAEPRQSQQVGLPQEAAKEAIPATNLQTKEKISLGKKLFFDGRLSVDDSVACATCHDPEKAFTDGRPVSIGVGGKLGQRNSPTALNTIFNKSKFWDGRVKTLEEQAALPIINPVEMGQPLIETAVAMIATIDKPLDKYPPRLFNADWQTVVSSSHS